MKIFTKIVQPLADQKRESIEKEVLRSVELWHFPVKRPEMSGLHLAL